MQRKAEIAEAVIGALKEVTNSDGYRRCAYYSHAGASVLNTLRGKPEYLPVFYRYEFKLGWNEGDQTKAFQEDTWASFKNKYDHVCNTFTDHCYILRETSGREEIVDFSTHMHGEYFKRKWGVISWNFSPPFFWDWSENVPTGYRTWFFPILASQADEKGFLKGEYDPQVTKDIADEALRRLGI